MTRTTGRLDWMLADFTRDIPGAEQAVTMVAFAIVTTLLLQATTAGVVARRLGLLDDPVPAPP